MIRLINFGQDRSIVGLIYVILSLLIASFAVGINVIVFPAILIDNNISALFIGLASANEIIFGFFATIYISRIFAKHGVVKSAVFVTIIYSLILYFIFYYKNYFLWLIYESIIGVCWISLFVVRQAWINHLIADKNRSIVLALTASIFCLGFMAGSAMVKIFGALNHICLIVSSILTLASGLLMLLVHDTSPKNVDSDHIKLKEFAAKLPNETLARFLLDFQAGCVILLGVVFGTKINLSVENSGLLIAAFMASGIFDLYAGVLTKLYDRRKLIIYGFLGCLLTMGIATILYREFYALIACFFLFGMSCAMIMVATLTSVNDKFNKSKLIAANATFQAVGSLGCVFGCLVGAIMIEIFGFYGFYATIFLAILTYLAYFFIKQGNNSWKL